MPRRVLVVDDDRAIRRLVVEILRADGLDSTDYEDGSQALGYLTGGASVDLVLLDMRMPVMDGWQFASEVRRLGIDVPVLVMTAASDARRWAREIAADGFVPKPFGVDELLAAVHEVLDRGEPVVAPS
ncbi:MAG: response regulator transcription factor [Dehalococcoidia bacterium]